MKLTKIALSLIVLAGGAITGGSWYTGKQAEEKYQEFVARANEEAKQLKAYGIEAQLSNVSFERGVFSSDVKYQLDVKFGDEAFVFNGNDQLFHGPLPLNRLKQGNFAPMLASIETEVARPEALKAFFDNKAILTGSNAITYEGGVDGLFTISPLKAEEAGEAKLQLSEIKTKYTLDKDGKGTSKVTVPSISLKSSVDELDVTILGTSYQINVTEKNRNYEMLGSNGDYIADIQSISVKLPKDEENVVSLFELKEIKTKGSNKVNGERYEGTSDFSAKVSLGKEGKMLPLGTFTTDMFMDAAAKPLNQIMSLVTEPALLAENHEHDEIIQASMMELMQTAPKLHVKSVALENEKGKIDFGLILNLSDFNPETLSSFDEAIAIFKQSSMTLNANIASIEEFIKNVQAATAGTEEGLEDPKMIVEQIVEQAKSSEGFVVENDAIKFKLEIDGGKVKLSDKELSEAEVQGILFMLMMSLGGMGL